MCQSQDTLLAAESTVSARQVRSRPLPVSLAGNQECPPPPSPNGSYQTHWEICGHEKTATNFPRGKRLCANSLRLSFLPWFYTFLPTVKANSVFYTTLISFSRQKKKNPPAVCVSPLFIHELLIIGESCHRLVSSDLSWNFIHHHRCLFLKYVEKMFHYCAGIFIILFLRGLNFSPTFFRFACVRLHSLYCAFLSEFSWKCSVFSTGILWPSNGALGHKTLERCWKRWRDRTDTKAFKELSTVVFVHFWMSQAYRGDVTFRGPALFSRLSWQNISVCVFLDSNGRIRSNSSPQMNQFHHFDPPILQVWGESPGLVLGFEADKEVIFKCTGSAVKHGNAFPPIPPTLPVQPSPSSVYRMQSNMNIWVVVSLCSEVEKWHRWICLCHRDKPPHLLNKTHHPTLCSL